MSSAARLCGLTCAALLVGVLGIVERAAEAICPSKGAPTRGDRAGGSIPPGLREPFDPPPEPEQPPAGEPEDPPPEEPSDPAPGAPGAPPPTTPPSGGLPPPPATTPPDVPPTTTPRGRTTPSRPDVLDDGSWQLWWGLNQADILPRVVRQSAAPDGGYARMLPTELRAAVDVLIAALSDDDRQVRYAAAGALAGFTAHHREHDVLLALRVGARGPDRWLRDLCHLALGLRGDAESLEPVRRVLRGGHEEAVSRAFAALALIHLGAPEGLADVKALASDLSEADVAGCVLVGLGETRDPAHLPVLLEAARRRTGAAVRLRRVRADALTALGRLAHPSTAPYLGELLLDRENAIARSAAIALGGFKGSAEAATLLREVGLTSEDPWVRALAAVSLGRVGDPSALPALVRLLREADPAVAPFVTLGIGLLGADGSERVLTAPLAEDPRRGSYGAAALAAGLLHGQTHRRALLAGVGDTRTSMAPACGALGLALLDADETRHVLRTRFWLDSTRARPGFEQALGLLDPEEQSAWLLAGLQAARRSSARCVLVDALAFCGGPAEGAALAARFSAAPKGDTRLRVRLLTTLAAILRDHEVTYARRLLLHTYYLQPNDVLGHLAYLP